MSIVVFYDDTLGTVFKIYSGRLDDTDFCPCMEVDWRFRRRIFCKYVFGDTRVQKCVHTHVCVWWRSENRQVSWNRFSPSFCTYPLYWADRWLEMVLTQRCVTPLCCIWMALKALLNPRELWFYHKFWRDPIWSFPKNLAIQYLPFINAST